MLRIQWTACFLYSYAYLSFTISFLQHYNNYFIVPRARMLVSQHSFLFFSLINYFSSHMTHMSTVLYYVFLLCFYSDCITVSQSISDLLSLLFGFVTSIGPCPTDRRARHYSGLRYDPGTLDGAVYPAATYFYPMLL